ncbi:VWA domain-containing protein [Zoogloeaceae bacterium G21618-S1]|nr:VWA domain-containing protein [Zoogloeaceae bacterium G21618-S1]
MSAAEAVTPLMFSALEDKLAALETLPRSLWLGGMTHSLGELESRMSALDDLRIRLSQGTLPGAKAWRWPGDPLAAPLVAVFEQLELARHCQREAALADTVLMSALFHLDLIVDYQDRGASVSQAARMAIDAFSADWRDRCGVMDELAAAFGQVPDLADNDRWDLLAGLLRSTSWQAVLQARRLIEQLPELAEVIRGLGRRHASRQLDAAGSQQTEIQRAAQATRNFSRSVRVPDLPGETRGIQRSDRISRMLPVESVLLGHPKLRLVWHARRAERALLTYEDDDRMSEVVHEISTVHLPTPAPMPAPRPELGPMLICVDTSGSMQGGAEAVAKAVVLEAARSAHAQQRDCRVFAFGGPGEVLEIQLSMDVDGVMRLTQFLGQAFRGGTDIGGPLERCLDAVATAPWTQADLLLATDGAFGATPALAARLVRVKAHTGLRVQGVLIGDRETVGLLELSDAIFWVRDWRRFGASDAASPVHSKSLTAEYFPGALRTPENRRSTVSGGEASQAVRAGQHAAPAPSPKDFP